MEIRPNSPDKTKRVLIIAEAGVNHNGDINIAKNLIDVASQAGVDFVKFQTFKSENLVSKEAKKAEYQSLNLNSDDDYQFNMLKKLELSLNDHKILIEYCQSKNTKFLSTAFDLESLDLLYSLGITLFKVPSGELTNLPYLKKVSTLAKEIIISTGMATLQEIKDALTLIVNTGFNKNNITILHCNTEYPTPMKDVNLLAMNVIGNEMDINIGYSDHTLGIEIPIAAVAMGAKIIEKHFTLDRNMEGPDHKASLEPLELIQMVKSIRNVEVAFGTGNKIPSESELKNIVIARKSIHIKEGVPKGYKILEKDLIMLRPGDGISPMNINLVLNKITNRNLNKGHKLSLKDLDIE